MRNTGQMKDYEQMAREHFDGMADRYDLKGGTFFSELPKRSCDEAAEFLKTVDFGALLDVGCGTGYLVRKLCDVKKAVYRGLDISPKMLAAARAKFLPSEQVKFEEGRSDALPFDDGTFDVVTCIMSFHHYSAPQKAVDEAYRVLKDGGIYFVSDVDKRNYVLTEEEVAAYDAEEMSAMMKEAGFVVSKAYSVTEKSFVAIGVKPVLAGIGDGAIMERDKDFGLAEMLAEFAEKGVTAMHMPGHKRNVKKFPYLALPCGAADITEIEGFDELHGATGILAEAQSRAAELWGSKRAFFSVNGSTGAVLAAVCGCTRRGDRVLIARNCHNSVYNAAEIAGLATDFVCPPVSEYGFCGSISPEDVDKALSEANYTAVIITSPTYEGVISDVPAIADTVHAHGATLIVDGAHGAHLGLSEHFPFGGAAEGADVVVCGAHKTLPSMTQTAILHVFGERVDVGRIEKYMSIFTSSSPSYPLMASLDGAVRYMKQNGNTVLGELRAELDSFYADCASLKALKVYDAEKEKSNAIYRKDPSKIYIDCTNCGLSGYDFKKTLRREWNTEAEYSSRAGVLCIASVGDGTGWSKRFFAALKAVDDVVCWGKAKAPCAVGKRAGLDGESRGKTVLPAKAVESFRAAELPSEEVSVSEAVGRVCAERVWIYPPGIPVVNSGEIVDENVAAILQRAFLDGACVKRECGGAGKIRVLASRAEA